MTNYKVLISSSAEKSIKKIPKKDIKRIIDSIQVLAINPYPQGCRKLMGEEHTYRIRTGKYRIIYEVQDKKLIILVLKIGHRKDVYQK